MTTPARQRLAEEVAEIVARAERLGENHKIARRLLKHAGILRAHEPLLADELVLRARAIDPFGARRAA